MFIRGRQFGYDMSPEQLDVIRTLSHLFKSETEVELEDAERILSFDLKFLSPGDAERAIKKLVEQGWIIQDDDEILTPALTLQNIEKTPLSWVPRPSRLLNPVSFSDFETGTFPTSAVVEPNIDQSEQNKVVENADEDGFEIQSSDPRVAKERLLLGFIARKTGLSKEEISRRQQRKNKALEPSTSWICLALIAREQGLEMNEIIAALSTF